MQFMNGEELVRQNLELQRNAVPVLSRGLKKIHPEAGDDRELQSLYNELLATLSQERVERVSVRSQATFEPTNWPHWVRVTRKMGKWHLYGYVRNGGQFLYPHEALHLIEINRLELYHNAVIVSLQQAYSLLLGTNITAEAYFVYSNLMRAGYVAETHQPANDVRPNFLLPKQAREAKRNDRLVEQCIWHCYELMQANRLDEAFDQQTDELLRSTACSMVAIADAIRNSSGESAVHDDDDDVGVMDDDVDDDPGWVEVANVSRKRTKWEEKKHTKKMAKIVGKEYRADAFLNTNLRVGNTDEELRQIFRNIQTIELSQMVADGQSANIADSERLHFDFDLYFATSTYRKSDPGQPKYRVIVRRSAAGPPSRQAILHAYLRQSFRARILVIFVSAAMSMQAYAYKFSQ